MSLSTFAEPSVFEPVHLTAQRRTVSVIIPCFNEERFIGKALKNLAGQYPAESYEIVLVDGGSTDRTRDVIAEFQLQHPDLAIRLLDNPQRAIPHGLNLGIAAASGEIIARIDAHAVPSSGYIHRCVEVLSEGAAEVVGMPCRVQPGADTVMARAIALAVSHPFGIGDAKYRLEQGRALQEEVDTVAFACFEKWLWVDLGGYDEKLLTNEDYDFNYRVRARGDRVVLDGVEHCDYFARPTLAKLAAQYLRYGAWKARMVRQRPRSIKVRHLVAPLFVVSIVLLTALGFWRGLAWEALALESAVYLLAAIGFSYQATRKAHASLGVMMAMPAAFLTIHFCWGASFLMGLVRTPQLRDRIS